MNDFLSRDEKNIWHPFTPLIGEAGMRVITHGRGASLFDSDGREIIDAISSWWVNLHGHAHPVISGAIQEQSKKLEHVLFAGFTHEPAIEVAEKLLTLAGSHFKKVFFSDNGSTAVEVALKLAIQSRKRNQATSEPHIIVAFENAYHGDTFGAMSVSGRGIFTEPFSEFLFQVERIPAPVPGQEERSFEAYTRLLRTQRVSTFIFEPLVLGAGGMMMYTRDSLDQLLSLSREFGVTTIADEVMTGFGRTGKVFATEDCVIKPDLMTLSKGITGGYLPLAVTLCSEKIVSEFRSEKREQAFFHGHSYTANPLACAAARASLDLLVDEGCYSRRACIEAQHHDFLENLTQKGEVSNPRVTGTILAFEIVESGHSDYLSKVRDPLYTFFIDNGVLIRPLGNTLYILPPYCIKKEELDRCYQLILEALEKASQF